MAADSASVDVGGERPALIGELLEWHFDLLSKSYLAPVLNDAMKEVSQGKERLTSESRLRENLALAAHVTAVSVALVPPGQERASWISGESQTAISLYRLYALISLANAANPYSEQGAYWITQAVKDLDGLWRSVEDRVQSRGGREDVVARLSKAGSAGSAAATSALSWFAGWQERNAPCATEFWAALRTAMPSHNWEFRQETIDAERRAWRKVQRETRRALPGARPAAGEVREADALDDAMAELNSLIGLSEVKQQVKALADYLRLQAMRKAQGLKTPDIALHFVFTGPPGTGKTTVARLLGKILAALGLLPDGHLVETSRQDLVAGYIGQTAMKADAVIDTALGGVLFIDEAYSLALEDPDKDFGREAIEVLLKRMEDDRDQLVVIAAGYPAEMDRFLAANPGLASRFTRTIDFPSYTPQELAQVLDLTVAANGYEMSSAGRQAAHQVIEEAWQRRTPTFGNARMIRTLAEDAIMRQATRLARGDLATLDPSRLSVLEPGDIPGFRGHVVSVEDVLAELSSMIGLAEVKQQVRALADFAAVQAQRKAQGLTAADVSRHLVFTGPPGTGKTTVARLIGKIYAALGMVASGHVIEASRQDLVGGYLGQTAIKTNKLIDRALGGVLFIDEAYTLAGGGEQDYGQEAIDTLLKRMEDDRAALAVIVAGYPAEMGGFLAANPGLASRFPRTIEFPSYAPGELAQILDSLVSASGYTMSARTREQAAALLAAEWEHRTPAFGNGRFVRNLVEAATLRQASRLSAQGGSALTPGELSELTINDLRGDAHE